MSTGWRTLTRTDLKTFDDHMTKAVLYAMENGGVGRISARGHAIIRNTSGQTMSVSRSAGGNRKANAAADLCRLFGAPVDNDQPPTIDKRAHANGVAVTSGSGAPDEPTLECPLAVCDAVFVTEGARYSHIETQHHKCTEPGCDYVSASRRGVAPHRRIAHEGHKPWKSRTDVKAKEGRATRKPTKATTASTDTTHTAPTSNGGTDDDTLNAIRKLLGDDPRVAQLQQLVNQQSANIDALVRQRDDLQAQLALVREALHLEA